MKQASESRLVVEIPYDGGHRQDGLASPSSECQKRSSCSSIASGEPVLPEAGWATPKLVRSPVVLDHHEVGSGTDLATVENSTAVG
jgi:hypothetical protein